MLMSLSTKARWIIYPFLIGAIVYLVLTQQQDSPSSSEKDYNSWIEPETRSLSAQIGDRIPFRLRIKNRGKKAWRSVGEFPCFLSYHLYLGENYRTVRFDNRRFPLPHVVEPGETIDMEITLRAPIEGKRYIIVFDMVREGKSWFRDYGSRLGIIRLNVSEKEWPEDKTTLHSSWSDIDKIMKIIRLTLHRNEVSFTGKTGRISGFAPGTDYPQIWLRDANTILWASRYFYGQDFLCSWLEEHLAHQKQEGSLEDWIDSQGKTDKNTTETDQETSAVQAAFQIHGLLGPRWLEKPIDGIRIIDRLDQALEFVWATRRDPEISLITGAHTADWGDVDLVDGDQKAIYVDDRTHWTADIYDQSMFYEACLNIAAMWDDLGNKNRRDYWEDTAKTVKDCTDKWLWQEDKGFYKIHIHLDSLRHGFDEEDMFAMGGNTTAILSGLADEAQTRSIILEALKRQEDHNLSTISGTLLPPYPKNIFKHPLLDDPFEYQNGAQWDWFGARLVYAMFQHGFSRLAKQKWQEIIHKNVENRGFFEWDNKEGVGLGSDFFAGSAGSMGKALFEGYFGIAHKRNDLAIEPKLGKDSAKIHIFQPANGFFFAFDYRFDENADRITMEFHSSFPEIKTVRILNPWFSAGETEEVSDQIEVFLDGETVGFKRERKNQDEFLIFRTDLLQHTVEIALKNGDPSLVKSSNR
jgi:hypothetical protein